MENEFVCRFCGKPCKNANSLRNHERLCKLNPNHQISNWVKWNETHEIWNKGLTKETDERVKKYGETLTVRYKGTEEGKRIFSHPHSLEYKQKMSEVAKQRHFGGWHTSRTFDYKGIKLDSQYELDVAKELDENQIKWERPSYFIWKDNTGNEHRYYPDFYLPEYNVYLDPKNDYLIHNESKRFGITDVEKIEKVQQQNGIRIIILDKDNLTWKRIKDFIAGCKQLVAGKAHNLEVAGSSPAPARICPNNT